MEKTYLLKPSDDLGYVGIIIPDKKNQGKFIARLGTRRDKGQIIIPKNPIPSDWEGKKVLIPYEYEENKNGTVGFAPVQLLPNSIDIVTGAICSDEGIVCGKATPVRVNARDVYFECNFGTGFVKELPVPAKEIAVSLLPVEIQAEYEAALEKEKKEAEAAKIRREEHKKEMQAKFRNEWIPAFTEGVLAHKEELQKLLLGEDGRLLSRKELREKYEYTSQAKFGNYRVYHSTNFKGEGTYSRFAEKMLKFLMSGEVDYIDSYMHDRGIYMTVLGRTGCVKCLLQYYLAG
jgi:hypothetical protein